MKPHSLDLGHELQQMQHISLIGHRLEICSEAGFDRRLIEPLAQSQPNAVLGIYLENPIRIAPDAYAHRAAPVTSEGHSGDFLSIRCKPSSAENNTLNIDSQTTIPQQLHRSHSIPS